MKSGDALPKKTTRTAQPGVAAPVLVDLISEVPGFTPPNQVRSSEKTHAIIHATLDLLKERGAGGIRMQDIAERAGCAVTAIYARFADRDVLYNAIHMLQLAECRPLLDEMLKPEALAGAGLLGVASAFVAVNEFYFDTNFNFVMAQLRSENNAAYRVTYEIMDSYAHRLAEAASVPAAVDAALLLGPIKQAIHTILAIYRDSVLGAEYFRRPSPEKLARLFTFIVDSELHAGAA